MSLPRNRLRWNGRGWLDRPFVLSAYEGSFDPAAGVLNPGKWP